MNINCHRQFPGCRGARMLHANIINFKIKNDR